MPHEYATDVPTDEGRKPSRLRRIFGGIGRVVGNPKFLGALQTGTGALSAQYGGSRIPLQLAMEREENEREDMLRAEEQARRAPMEALQLENERLRQQILNKQIGAFRPPLSPEQEIENALKLERGKQEVAQEFAKPERLPTIDPETQETVYAEFRRGQEPVIPRIGPLVPTKEQPALPQAPVAPPLAGIAPPITPAQPPVQAQRRPLRVPPKEDTAVSAYEDFRRKYSPTPEGQAQAASDWQKLGRPTPQGIPGGGTDIFQPGTGKYMGKWFAETNQFIPIPENLGGGPQTADERNKANARQRLSMGMTELESLGQRVITGKQAVAQRAVAAGRTAESVLGNDPDWLTYQAAREALGLQLAVASQGGRPSDYDAKAWVKLIPDVFADTQDSANLKWQFVRNLISLPNRNAGPTGQFTVTDPRGKVHTFFSQQEADEFKRLAGIK